jgi:plasmid stability protein
MAQLLLRNLENDVNAKLQRCAKRHGRSMEEEVREILRDGFERWASERAKRFLRYMTFAFKP